MLRRFVRGSGFLAVMVLVLLVGLWLASGWYWIFLSDSRYSRAYLFDGRLELSIQDYREAAFWAYGPRLNGQFPGLKRGMGWTFTWGGSWLPRSATGPMIDLIGASLAIALPCLFWPIRRRRSGHCQVCDYNLTGNESGRCPECGAETGALSPAAI